MTFDISIASFRCLNPKCEAMPDLTTLNNGLRVISDTMSDTETVSVSLWANVGSRYETQEQNGIAHFLEHMAFKGTQTRTARQIAEEFDNIGGYLNASTSREHTVYYAKMLKDDFACGAEILADILQNSTFDEEELERERGVVLQEIAMTNDTPDDIVFDYFQETAFANQPIGRSILGPEERVKAFSRNDLLDYIDTYYSAPRLVLSVAGNIEHEKVVQFAKGHLAGLKSEARTDKTPAIYSGGDYRKTRDLEQVHFVMGFDGVSYHHDDIYTIQLLSLVMGGGMSSRLFQEIREKRGLAYSVSTFNSNYEDSGLFTLYAGTAPEQLGELINVTCDELKKATDNIGEEELNRAKAQARAGLLMGMETSGFRADEMGRNLTCFDRHIPVSEMLEKIAEIGTRDIAIMMQKILTSSKPTITAIGQVDGLDDYETIVRKLAV